MKDIPLGIDDFKKVRDIDVYYIDKTGLIIDIVSNPGTGVFLFTRPRRFGKSLNMSMLDAFFNNKYSDNRWFDGLKVMSDADCRKHMNSYPVISVSLSGLCADDYSEFTSDLKVIVSEICMEHQYLMDWESNSTYKREFTKMLNGEMTNAELKRSLRTLSTILHEYHGKKTIVLIDEYDNVINKSYGRKTHERILNFMRDFLSNVLKSNEYLQFGIMTGVTQIAKENIFSGLNNLYANNIFSDDFDEEFGFTDEDVTEMLNYYGHPEKLDEVRDWYDGYRFGNADIYNPWSIVNYVKKGFVVDSYWLNEGNPSIILESLNKIGPDAVKIIADLYNNGLVEIELNKNMVFAELNSIEGLLSLLTCSGYLKAIPNKNNGKFTLNIVNNEVRRGFLEQLNRGVWNNIYMNRISKALLNGSPDDVKIELEIALGSHLDSKIAKDERYYQAFILGLLNCLTSEYYIESEYRGGKGYADIAIIPRNGNGSFAIIELKDEVAKTKDERMRMISDKALEQIKNHRYFVNLHGLIRMYGIATRQTDVFISYKEIVNG